MSTAEGMDPRGLARLIAETVRDLNHATAGPEGYERPIDVDAVLGELRLTVIRMEQTLDQARSWLARCHAAGRVEHSKGRDIDAAISSAVYRIGEAADRTEWLAMDLTEVRAITAHLESPHPPSVVTPTRVMEDPR